MKRIILIAAAAASILLFFSCQKELSHVKVSEPLEFTGTIGDIQNPETKTTLTVDRKVNWVEGDEISVNGIIYTASPTSTDPTVATFTRKEQAAQDPTAIYHAYYPAELYGDGTPKLQEVQTFVAGCINNGPMYAESNTTFLSFHNICALLEITVKNTITVKNIKVSSDLAMNGAFTVIDDKAVISGTGELTEADKSVTLDCGAGVAGTTFHIAVPAGDYSGQNLKITVTDTADEEREMLTNQSASIIIEANTIYSFSFKESIAPIFPGYEMKAISFGNLWVAPVNCEYDDDESNYYPYGLLYQWGRKYGQGYHDDDFSDPTYPSTVSGTLRSFQLSSMAEGNQDTTALNFYYNNTCWYQGSKKKDKWLPENCPCPDGWRLPTSAEFTLWISSATKKEWIYNGGPNSDLAGCLLTTSAGEQIFLPAAGYHPYQNENSSGRETHCYYYSSSVPPFAKNTFNAFSLDIYISSGSIIAKLREDSCRGDGYAIRCVRD